MSLFDWIVAGIVLLILIYLSFVLTLADWLKALKKGQAVTLLPERKGGTWPLWTQIAMLILGLALCVPLFYFLWIPIIKLSIPIGRVLDLVGLVVYLAGCAFVLWARRTLGKMWGISTSQNVKLRDDHQIIQSGPYAFVRNPMYFGWWVAMLGLVLVYPTWVVLSFLAFSVIAFIGRARREDKALAERFGEAWNEYKKKTRFLIPFIY
jgi:protein-S-isoprenylcysteine O-methyltransferase Ste14